MPVKAYFKARGASVRRDMIKRYGKERGTRIFYATAAKQRMRPGDSFNLKRPKKSKRTPKQMAMLKTAFRAARAKKPKLKRKGRR